MAITLKTLTQLPDGRFYAKWYDYDEASGLGHTVAALHHADGRLDAANFNIRAPRLTPEQMATARPDLSPAQELAAKGTAVRPDWSKRYEKAAQLVDSGAVRLTSEETAVVTGSSDTYTITNACTCKWAQHNSDPCSHYLAVRIARALGQPIQPTTEAEREASLERASEARARAAREAKVARQAARGENLYYKQRRQARKDGDGARQWMRAAMANGRQTIPAHIYNRAVGQGGD